MAESHLIGGLVSKHRELAGQIDHHQKQIKNIQKDLAAIAGAIKVIEPEFNLREIKAKAVKPQNRFFKNREASQLLLEAFRNIGGDIKTCDLHANVAQKKGLDLEAMEYEDRRAFKATLFTILKRMEGRELIQQVGKDGTAVIWQLLPSTG